jgi:hypothetical protein
MKSLMMRLTIAAAALAAVAGSASAQTYKARIPMAFRAGDKVLAAGSYEFVVTSSATGHQVIWVRSAKSSNSALLVPVLGSDASKEWQSEGTPKIAFECLGSSCSLRRFWKAEDTSTLEFPARKVAPAEKERIAFVTVGLTKATD